MKLDLHAFVREHCKSYLNISALAVEQSWFWYLSAPSIDRLWFPTSLLNVVLSASTNAYSRSMIDWTISKSVLCILPTKACSQFIDNRNCCYKKESPPWAGHRQLGGAVVGARLGSRPGNKLFTGEPTIFHEEMGKKSFIFRTKS